MRQETYPEAYIDYWALIFLANNFYETHGLEFQRFLEMPHEYLMAAVYHLPWPLRAVDDFYPLLPAQQAVADRIQQIDSIDLIRKEVAEIAALIAQEEAVLDATPAVECRNGQWHQPLHHHAHPRKPSARRMPA